ncbi:hypothetical protein OS493_022717 [Desmophyllum pertusum]|uniref:Insulin-like domain-containing protein n=1 Tax=Desmophyllum pertusum TaxID=174260 RepID=A0A9X0CE34_9CNID|nr:hypothetical protein OS493_022717 [Desmophyllum pertusum]
MKNSCFWSTVALLAIVLCLETVTGTQLYKVNEVGNRAIDAHYCGDQITAVYNSVCFGVRKRRSALMDEKEALSFLHFRSRRQTDSATASSGGPTDITEECCTEGCAHEEVREYC